MPAAVSRLERMARNPYGDCDINDIQTVCRENDLICMPPRGGGSHYKVSDQSGEFTLIIPARRRIKAVYIKAFVGFIKRLQDKAG